MNMINAHECEEIKEYNEKLEIENEIKENDESDEHYDDDVLTGCFISYVGERWWYHISSSGSCVSNGAEIRFCPHCGQKLV